MRKEGKVEGNATQDNRRWFGLQDRDVKEVNRARAPEECEGTNAAVGEQVEEQKVWTGQVRITPNAALAGDAVIRRNSAYKGTADSATNMLGAIFR
jgi:hypothetical protein